MLRYQLKPDGLFTWNSTLSGDDVDIKLKINWFKENGSFECSDNDLYHIKNDRRGFLKRNQNLMKNGKHIGSSIYRYFFNRKMTLTLDDIEYTLSPKSLFSMNYILKNSSKTIIEVTRDNYLSRKSTITCHQDVSLELLGYATWCTLFSWRRSSRNHNGG